MIVMKFGGTSVGSAEAIRRVAEIVAGRLDRRPLVVVSAVAGVTDKLVALSLTAPDDAVRAEEIVQYLIGLHRSLKLELGLGDDAELESAVGAAEEILQRCCRRLREKEREPKEVVDELLGVGEFLSAALLAAHFRKTGIDSRMVDARQIIKTDSRFGMAQPNLEESLPLACRFLLPLIEGGTVPVCQGFVGSDRQGRFTTLGRGGSDYSATLIGSLLGAECVEIWSDVDGVLTADPTLVPEAQRIRQMTFQEAAELAYFGARVLHPSTLLPAVAKEIPVLVLNSTRPDRPGTRIGRRIPEMSSGTLAKSIAYKENVTVITVQSTRMLMSHGFLAAIFEVFSRHQTSVDLVSTSEVSVSLTIDNVENLQAILDELSRFAQVEAAEGKAIVCVVGERMRRTKGAPAKIFGQLLDVEIHLISQGASEINISFVIDEGDIAKVVRRLHGFLFEPQSQRREEP